MCITLTHKKHCVCVYVCTPLTHTKPLGLCLCVHYPNTYKALCFCLCVHYTRRCKTIVSVSMCAPPNIHKTLVFFYLLKTFMILKANHPFHGKKFLFISTTLFPSRIHSIYFHYFPEMTLFVEGERHIYTELAKGNLFLFHT